MMHRALLYSLLAGTLLAHCLALSPTCASAATPPTRASSDTFDISADSGQLISQNAEDFLTLNGHVRLIHGSTVITADTGEYLRAAKQAIMSGHVVVQDSTTHIESEIATYYRAQSLAILEGGVTLTDKDVQLTAQHLSYNRATREATASGSPHLRQKGQELWANAVTWKRDSDTAIGDGDVHGIDHKERIEVWGAHVEYSRQTKSGVLEGAPRFLSTEDDSTQTLVSAQRLQFTNDPKVVTAIDSVRVTRKKFSARADTMVLYDATSRAVLTGHPQAWDDQARISADSLDLYFVKRALDHARAISTSSTPARVRYAGAPSDTTGHGGKRSGHGTETVQLEGSRLAIAFVHEEVHTIDVGPPATATYTYEEPHRPERTETNDVRGDSMHAELSPSQVEMVLVTGAASGEYHFHPDDQPTKDDVVSYKAPWIVFHVPNDRVVMRDGAEVTHEKTVLQAPEIAFNSRTEAMQATGAVSLNDGSEVITGSGLTYELKSGHGTILEGRTRFDKGFYGGQEMRKVDDKTYAVKNAVYTTCDLPHPHYGIAAKAMKIQVGKRVIARPVLFYLGKVPIFALPFFVIPVDTERHSGVLFPNLDFGFNAPQGRFFRNLGYYWAPSQYWDATGTLDFFEGNPYLGTHAHYTSHLKAEYNVRRVPLSGEFNFTYGTQTGLGDRDYVLFANHRQSLPWGIFATGSANLANSVTVLGNSSYSGDQRRQLRGQLSSSLQLSRSWYGTNVAANFQRDEVLAQKGDSLNGIMPVAGSVSGYRPQLLLSFPTIFLGHTASPGRPGVRPWLASTRVGVSTNYQDRFTNVAGTHSYRALSTSASLNDARRLGWVSVSPSFNLSDVRYAHDLSGRAFTGYDRWNASLSANATLYGYFLHKVGPLLGVRHVLSPSLSYAVTPSQIAHLYQNPESTNASLIPVFPDGTASFAANAAQTVSLAVDQRFQVKIKAGERVVKLDNLISTSTRVNYDLAKGKFSSDITSSLRLAPLDRVNASVTWDNLAPRREQKGWGQFRNVVYSLNTNVAGSGQWDGLRSSTSRAAADSFAAAPPDTAAAAAGRSYLSPGDLGNRAAQRSGIARFPWSFGLSAGATRRQIAGVNRFNGVFAQGTLDFSLTPNWRVSYSAAYDFDRGQLTSQDYSLSRTLHCWEATFRRSNSGGVWTYYFRIGVKDLPQLFFERGSRYIGTPRFPFGN